MSTKRRDALLRASWRHGLGSARANALSHYLGAIESLATVLVTKRGDTSRHAARARLAMHKRRGDIPPDAELVVLHHMEHGIEPYKRLGVIVSPSQREAGGAGDIAIRAAPAGLHAADGDNGAAQNDPPPAGGDNAGLAEGVIDGDGALERSC